MSPFLRVLNLFMLISTASALLVLCYLRFATPSNSKPISDHTHAASSFLFPASALISLTDDNSTSFISRSAAFGPNLPKNGLDGELFVLEEGQLACDDTAGWDPSASPDTAAPIVNDDGTDNILNPTPPPNAIKTAGSGSGHADIESLQQSAEIGGKIVLVQRGGCGFLEKVMWAQRRGGIALIVGDYKRPGVGSGNVLVTMFAKGDTSNVSIPSVFISHTTAALLTTLLPDYPGPGGGGLVQPSMPMPLTPNSLREPSLARPKSPAGHPQLAGGRIPEKAGRLQPTTTPTTTAAAAPTAASIVGSKKPPQRTGLWVTLTPTTMTKSPFFDTMMVLVVSPLVTLTGVYGLLLIRARIRRRRWRAPKSLVQRLPVRTYQSTSSPPPSLPFPPRTSSLPHRGRPDDRHSDDDQPVPPVSPPPRRGAASPTQSMMGRAFHRRWSGCNECVVCLEEYVDGISKVMKLPCGHEFHADCITPWLTTRRRTCPICKGDVVRGIRAITNPETAVDGANETTPLVMNHHDDDHISDPEEFGDHWTEDLGSRG